MKYSTVIFDLDGTLLDTSEGIMNGAKYTANKMGFPKLSIEQQKNFIGPPILESFTRECGTTSAEARKAVEIYRKRYKEKGIYEAKKYNHIKELLIELKEHGYRTGVATLKRDDFAKEILDIFSLSKYFDVIKGIDNKDKHSKADIISICLNKMKLNDLSKAVLIGDSIYDGIGAEQAGIDFIAVTYGYGFKNKYEANKVKNVFIAEEVEDIFHFFIHSNIFQPKF